MESNINIVFSQRLRRARQIAMLSMDALVKKINGLVTKSAISKYEKGEMFPSSTVLIALAKALEVKPDYFYRPLVAEIEKVDFRKRSSLGARKIAAIKQRVIDHTESYLEIENLLQMDRDFVNPLEHIQVSSQMDIELATRKLLNEWNLGINALPNVLELLEEKDIKVVLLDADEAFDGLSGWAVHGERRVPVVVVNQNYSIERIRFTALHELGHLLLSFTSDLTGKEIERLCHCFAGAMLLPEPTLYSEVGTGRSHISLRELISVKIRYGISVQAIMARASSLRVISAHSYKSFRKRVSKNRTEEGWGAYQGDEKTERFSQLVFRAAAEEVISLSKAANLLNMKLAEFRDEFVLV